jgi:hypothetical protein
MSKSVQEIPRDREFQDENIRYKEGVRTKQDLELVEGNDIELNIDGKHRGTDKSGGSTDREIPL